MRVGLGVVVLVAVGIALWMHRPRPAPAAHPIVAREVETEAPSARTVPVWHEVDPTGTLRLEGQVIDADERPVAGAFVTLGSTPPRVARTEPDGSFVFAALTARSYVLEARTDQLHAGPVEAVLTATSDPVILRMTSAGTLDVEVRDPDGAAVDADVELRVTQTIIAHTEEGIAHLRGTGLGWGIVKASAKGYAAVFEVVRTSVTTQRVRLVLRKGAAARGCVHDERGAPVAGAAVLAEEASQPFQVADVTRDGVVTGTDGCWQIDALAQGSYRFVARHPDYAPATTPPITLDGVHERGGLDLRLSAGAILRGDVDEGGQPVRGARVRVVGRHRGSWEPARETVSDEHGAFVLRGLSGGEVEVLARSSNGSSAATPLTLRTGEQSVHLSITTHGAISGLAVDRRGTPVPEARVSIEPLETAAVWVAQGLGAQLADGAGRFRWDGVAPGTYLVRASGPGTDDGELYASHAVTCQPGDDVKVVVEGHGTVSGRVQLASGAAPALYSVQIGSAEAEPFIAGDGTFSLRAPTGHQLVIVSGPTFQRAVKSIDVSDTGDTDVGTIVVEPGRSLSGRVLDASGAPVSGATVAAGVLLTGDGTRVDIPDEGIGVREVTTDDRGAYEMRGFGATSVVLVADKAGVGRSPSLRVPPSPGSVTLDLVLGPTASLSGVVTRNGEPVPQTVVIANPRGALSSNFFVLTGADGSYAFDRLAPGDWVVAPMLGGGGLRPKDMFYVAATLVSEQATRADVAIEDGNASASVRVLDARGQPAQALLFVVPGAIAAVTSESLLDGAWLTNRDVTPQYFRACAGEPASITAMKSGGYTFCALPVADLNDPTAMRTLRDRMNSLPLVCTTAAVTGSGSAVTVTLR